MSYASGLRDNVPDVASLFVAGELDMIIEASRTAEAFEVTPSPSWLWAFANTGHLAFSDLCAIGSDDSNLIDLGEQAGLGGFLDESVVTDGVTITSK